jgi:hypothetical protein
MRYFNGDFIARDSAKKTPRAAEQVQAIIFVFKCMCEKYHANRASAGKFDHSQSARTQLSAGK